jgi:hypothetical protein
LSDGRLFRDLDGVEAAGRGNAGRPFGAVQFQVITDTEWGDSERDELFRQLVGAAGPLLRTARGGVKQ